MVNNSNEDNGPLLLSSSTLLQKLSSLCNGAFIPINYIFPLI